MRTSYATSPARIAVLPRAPINASPVPGLTSLYHKAEARPLRRPRLPGQLLGRPHQGPAALLPAAKRPRPDDRLAAPAATSAASSASTAARRTSAPGFDACDPATLRRASARSTSSGCTRRTGGRSSTPTTCATCARAPTLEHFLYRYEQLIAQLRRRAQPRRQAGDPDGRLQRPRGGLRAAGLPHQAARLRGGPAAALHRHHPLQPRREQRQEGLPLAASSPACTTPASCFERAGPWLPPFPLTTMTTTTRHHRHLHRRATGTRDFNQEDQRVERQRHVQRHSFDHESGGRSPSRDRRRWRTLPHGRLRSGCSRPARRLKDLADFDAEDGICPSLKPLHDAIAARGAGRCRLLCRYGIRIG